MRSKHCVALVLGLLGAVAPFIASTAFGEPPDPCTLLTQTKVSAVLGVPVGNGSRVAPTLCGWEAPGPKAMNTKRVTITFQDPRAFEYAKAPAGKGITKVPVSGIGDEAVQGTTPKFATTLTVKKGSNVFVVHVWGFPIDQPFDLEKVQAMEKALALEAASKL
jgi:hypothetical protein